MRFLANALIGLVVFLALSCQATGQIAQAGKCEIDRELIELPSCAIETRDGQLYVAVSLLKSFLLESSIGIQPFRVGRRHLTAACSEQTCWFYFDKNGRILVKDVAELDWGPSPFHHGLVRVARNGKWGLANMKGNLVVPMELDGILEFYKGRWLGCKGCTSKMMGDYSYFSGGNWFAINRHGKIVGPVENPIHEGSN